MKGNHFEERRPCLQLRHRSVGRGGHGQKAGALGMDGERKEAEKPGSKFFLRTGEQSEQSAFLSAGVFSQWEAMAIPKGQDGCVAAPG